MSFLPKRRILGLMMALLAVAVACARADYRVREESLKSVQQLAKQLASEPNDLDASLFLSWPQIHHVVTLGERGAVLSMVSNPVARTQPDAVVTVDGRVRRVEIATALPSYQALAWEFPLWALCLLCLAVVLPRRDEPGAAVSPSSSPLFPGKAVSSLEAVVLELDPELRIRRASRGVESLGHHPDDLVGKPVTEVIDRFQPDESKKVHGVRGRAGGQVDSLVSSATVSDSEGMKTLVVTLSQPTSSDSEGLRSRYRQLETICNTVCDNAREAIVVMDPAMTLWYGNRSSSEVTGQETMLGLPFLEMVAPQHRMLVANALTRALQEGTSEPLELELYGPQSVVLEGSFHPLGSRSDTTWSLAMGIFRDVSEARRLHQELERTRERAGHSQKIEALGRMAGGVAHDFNNLLTTVSINLETVHSGLPQEHHVRPYLEEIRLAVGQAINVSRQLLLYSRKKPLEPVCVSCHQAVNNALRLSSSLLGTTTLRVDLGANRHHVLLEEGQLDQVLLNLLMNAKDALGDGGTISVSTRDDGTRWILDLTDDGPGVPTALASKVFEPYFTTKPAGKGTGLGLSTAAAIVEKAGGSLQLRSRPGETTFELALPLYADAAAAPGAGVETSPLSAAQGRNVLLVEDERSIRVLLSRMLQERDLHVVAAATGQQAATLLALQAYDLLVTDLVLPDLGGVELAQQFRAACPQGKVLYISGFPGDNFNEASLGSQDRFLTKPFSQQQFVTTLDQLLGSASE